MFKGGGGVQNCFVLFLNQIVFDPVHCYHSANDLEYVLLFYIVDTYCEHGYVQYRRRCYKMNSDVKSFNDASAACQAANGTLATVGDSQEQAFINCKLI